MRKLDAREKVFVDEYLIDLDPKRAAIKAGYSETVAASKAYQWVSNCKVKPHVFYAIQERQKDREKRTEITQDMVLKRWWQIANADPNELISYRRVCCRHCFGLGHAYQWIDEDEFKRAVKSAEDFAKENGHKPVLPKDEGGYGFDATISPHPKCPKCNGEGMGQVFAHDTRFLSEEAKALYAGVKITKEGLEIKMQDQGKALENVARHLGMFNDKLTLKGDAENPLLLLLKQVSGSSLPVVKDEDAE